MVGYKNSLRNYYVIKCAPLMSAALSDGVGSLPGLANRNVVATPKLGRSDYKSNNRCRDLTMMHKCIMVKIGGSKKTQIRQKTRKLNENRGNLQILWK